MAFGNGENKERRKTSHINDQFRKYLKEAISGAVGLPLDERQAMTVFKVIMRSPIRFLMTLEEKDFDKYGERSVALAGVGKFKIVDTIAQGKRVELVGEGGKYPRYKYYPASSVEAEVEILNGLENEESRETYDKTVKSEKANIELNVQEIASLVGKLMEEAKGEVNKRSKKDNGVNALGDVFMGIISTVIEHELSKRGITSEVGEEDFEELEDSYEVENEEVENEEVENDEVENDEVVEEVKEVKKKETKKKETKKKETKKENKKEEESDSAGINEAVKNFDFDFDFNT